MNMNSLRVAVIGLGVGEAHAKSFELHPHCEVTMLCDLSEKTLQKVGASYPKAVCTKNADEVLDSDHVDVVSIASYDDVHGQQVIKALEQGKHVFVEKPLCFYESEAKRIHTLLQQGGGQLQLSSNLVLRQSPRFLQLKDMVVQGRLGDLYYVEADYNYGRLNKIIDGWRGKLEYYSAMLGGGVHMVDMLCWLVGSPVVEVMSYGNNICSQGSDFKFNDLVVGLLNFENDVVAKVSANFGCVQPHFHQMSVYGTQATFVNGDPFAKLITSRESTAEPEVIDSAYPGVEKGVLIHNFVDSLLGKARAFVSENEIFDVMSVCFALEESMQTSQPVQVKYL